MAHIDYLIVGAGFAGCVCADQLAVAGKHVLIIDKRPHIGGHAYDEYDDAGILVQRYGAHVWHTNSREVHEYVSRFTTWRPYVHRVLSSIDGGRFVPMPINQTTLEMFGGDLLEARRVLIDPYTRKQWGPYAADLAASVFARIPSRADRDDRYFTDTYQGIPAQGYTRLFERMLAHPRIAIWLKVTFDDAWALLRPDWDEGNVPRPHVIYSGPIDEYFNHCLGRLPYRSARFKFETLNQPWRQVVGVMNYPSEAVPYTRIIEFKHLTGQEHRQTTIAYEYPTSEGGPYWPVPTAETEALYQQYRLLATSRPDVHFVGRLGTYRYYDMHQVVAQALTLSARLLQREAVCP